MRKKKAIICCEMKKDLQCCEKENRSDDIKIQIKFVVSLCVNDDISSMFRINEHDVSTEAACEAT